MLEVRQKDVGTLLQVKSLDQTLRDGGDEVPSNCHAAEIQIDQEPSYQGKDGLSSQPEK
mgnify:CR=1 FL=1